MSKSGVSKVRGSIKNKWGKKDEIRNNIKEKENKGLTEGE